jgi:DNA-binding MarR family transcriptional regulator
VKYFGILEEVSQMADSAPPLSAYLSHALAAAHREIHTALTQRLKAHGVQVEAWRIMETLDEMPDVTMSQLANLVLMNPPTLTKLVDRMVSDNLVHRQISRRDQRQVNLVLTDLGLKRISQIREEVRSEDNRIESIVGSENFAVLNEMLTRIYSRDS